MSWLRRLFSSAPLSTVEGLGLILGGVAGWALAIAQSRPEWAPGSIGWVVVVISIAAIVRGGVGMAASAGVGLRSFLRPGGWPGNRAPRTEEENAQVLAKRPFGWEYLYFAGVLSVERARMDSAYFDHELRYARPSGETLPNDLDAVKAFISERMDEAKEILSSLMVVMESDAQERAFGEPGTEGDPGRIHQLAVRWNTAYADFLDWAARLRGAAKPAMYRNVFEAVARLADAPVTQYREFVTSFVEAADEIPDAGRKDRPLSIELELALEMDAGAIAVFETELERLQEALDHEDEDDYEPSPMTMTQREEREAIRRDARRHRDTFKLMGRVNGIAQTADDVQNDYRQRVIALQERRDAYIAKYGQLSSAGDVKPIDMQGPEWLQDIVNDLHRIVVQMGGD
jgi:hypothetical protein